jgi:hypothetical protein
MAEHQIRYSMAGCPLCGHYGPHIETPGDPSVFTCRLCQAGFGVGRSEIRTMVVSDRDHAGATTA